MPYVVDDVHYPTIQPPQAAPSSTQAEETLRVGSTWMRTDPEQVVLMQDDSIAVTVGVDYNAPSVWNQPANYSWGPISNLVTDPSVDGFAGASRVNGYTLGGVESNTVENFELDGRQGQFPMQPATGYGPVGFSNAAGVLGASLAQDAYDFPTPYESGVSVIQGF